MESNKVIDWEYAIKKRDEDYEEIIRFRSVLNDIKTTEESIGELMLREKDLKILMKINPFTCSTASNFFISIPIKKRKWSESEFEIDC
jgi:hypothetical protein